MEVEYYTDSGNFEHEGYEFNEVFVDGVRQIQVYLPEKVAEFFKLPKDCVYLAGTNMEDALRFVETLNQCVKSIQKIEEQIKSVRVESARI